MVKIYGSGDDAVVIKETGCKTKQVNCYMSDVVITFADGTQIRVGYPKEKIAVWWIELEKSCRARKRFVKCDDEDAEIYSDVFQIESEIVSHDVVEQKYPDGKPE